MTSNIQFSEPQEVTELARIGHEICTALVKGDLNKCVQLLSAHAKNTGFVFSSETVSSVAESSSSKIDK